MIFSNSPNPDLSNGIGLMSVYALWKKLLGVQGRSWVGIFEFSSFLQGGAKHSSSIWLSFILAGWGRSGIFGPGTVGQNFQL